MGRKKFPKPAGGAQKQQEQQALQPEAQKQPHVQQPQVPLQLQPGTSTQRVEQTQEVVRQRPGPPPSQPGTSRQQVEQTDEYERQTPLPPPLRQVPSVSAPSAQAEPEEDTSQPGKRRRNRKKKGAPESHKDQPSAELQISEQLQELAITPTPTQQPKPKPPISEEPLGPIPEISGRTALLQETKTPWQTPGPGVSNQQRVVDTARDQQSRGRGRGRQDSDLPGKNLQHSESPGIHQQSFPSLGEQRFPPLGDTRGAGALQQHPDQQGRRVQQPTQKRTSQQQQRGAPAADTRGAGPIQHPSSQPAKLPEATTKEPTSQPAESLQLALPQRKKFQSAGTAGRRIRIETNHLALSLKNLKQRAVHYDVTLDPDTPKKLLRPAMEEFRRKYYPQRYPAYDGQKNLYCSGELPVSVPFTGDVVVKNEERDRAYKITIKFAAHVDLSEITKYLEAVAQNRQHMLTPQDAIQCLDIVLRNAPSLNCIPVGRSFFTQPRNQIINLGEGMEMYYGFYQSAILGWKPFLNVDVSHKPFPKCIKVIDAIVELCGSRYNPREKLASYQRETVDKFLRTLKVQYEIPNAPATKRVMRINQLDVPASEAWFSGDDGKKMTVQQYFQREKRCTLQYPHLPCLWVGNKQRQPKILIPPELCIILPRQVTNRTMTANQTSEMIKVAATSTHVRKQKIMASIDQAHYNQDPTVLEFGITVNHEFEKIGARVLDSPRLSYRERQEQPKRGVWRAQRFLTGRNLEQWGIVSVDDRTNIGGLREFTSMLIQQSKDLGMVISQPTLERCIRLTYRKEKDELEHLFKECAQLQLVIVVIPTENKDVYNYVKQTAELRVGTLTQCVKGRNVFRPKPSTVGNILLKINAKLDGVNHILYNRPRCLQTPCMIMGADVTHPSPETRGTVPSVAAVTASHDPAAFKYNICWRLQPPAQEIIEDLDTIMKEHLMYFYTKSNGHKPERIIFFRDGVSEGQFNTVLKAEIYSIRAACSRMGSDGLYKPKITFLVVQKRHHTRFFPTNPNDSEDKNMNVPAGTVVDTDITHPTALDFYLVSHASIQGVARPTKYRMLWDDNDMNEDELEQLTYHLCHMFTRCTRSVSYPAPTYYAHLAAARAKVYCEHRNINLDSLKREQENLVIQHNIIKERPMFFV